MTHSHPAPPAVKHMRPETSAEANLRYHRQLLIPGFDQSALGRARVLVAGVGTLGSAVVLTLTLAGVAMKQYGGELVLADFDKMEEVNVTRWALGVHPGDIGRNKAIVAAERIAFLNPDVNALPMTGNLVRHLGAVRMAMFDVVVLCVDNLEARMHLNRYASLWAGIKPIPIVEGGLDGMNWAIHSFIPGEGPCYECLMVEGDYQDLNRRRSCLGQPLQGLVETPMPMSAVSAAPAAGIMCQEVVQILMGQPPAYAGRELRFHAGTGQPARVFTLKRRTDCSGHSAIDPNSVMVLPFSEESLLGEVRTAVALRLGVNPQDVTLVLDRDVLYSRRCPKCDFSTDANAAPCPLDDAPSSPCPLCGLPDLMPDISSQLLADGFTLREHGVPALHMLKVFAPGHDAITLLPQEIHTNGK